MAGSRTGVVPDAARAPPVAELVDRLKHEYAQACREFAERMPAEALAASKVAAE